MGKLVMQEYTERPVIPEGEILAAEVTRAEIRETPFDDGKGGKKKEVSFSFKITEDGDYSGYTVFGSAPLTFSQHPDCKLRLWSQELLGGGDLPVGFELDTDDLVGLPCRVQMGVRVRVAQDGKTEIQRNFVADVIQSADVSLNPF